MGCVIYPNIVEHKLHCTIKQVDVMLHLQLFEQGRFQAVPSNYQVEKGLDVRLELHVGRHYILLIYRPTQYMKGLLFSFQITDTALSNKLT